MDPEQLRHTPQHVAIIMDGNGRWAKQRGKPRFQGHRAGTVAVRRAVEFARQRGIKALTLYAFSSENWQRPEQEVSMLMKLFMSALGREVDRLHEHNIRLRVIGDISAFSVSLQEKILDAQALTANNTSLTLNIAANYGGHWDIAQAARRLASLVETGQMSASDIDEQALGANLCLADQPPVDLLIRTGGEQRISNFLLWQLAYSELYFTPLYWPDFDEAAFASAIEVFGQRERRYGCTSEQVAAQPVAELI